MTASAESSPHRLGILLLFFCLHRQSLRPISVEAFLSAVPSNAGSRAFPAAYDPSTNKHKHSLCETIARLQLNRSLRWIDFILILGRRYDLITLLWRQPVKIVKESPSGAQCGHCKASHGCSWARRNHRSTHTTAAMILKASVIVCQ